MGLVAPRAKQVCARGVKVPCAKVHQKGCVQGVLVQNGHLQGVWECLVQMGLVQNGHMQWGREHLVQNSCVQGVWESRVQGVLVQNGHVKRV